MRTVNLTEGTLGLEEVLKLARKGPVLLLATDGKEFLISKADDFEAEVEALRKSRAFQRFLDGRSKRKRVVPLEEIEKEIQKELAKPGKTA